MSTRLGAGRRPVDEKTALGNDLLPGLQVAANLDQIAVGQTGLDIAKLNRLVVTCDPEPNTVALVDQRSFRHPEGWVVLAGIDRHTGEHLRLEHAVLVVDCRADEKPPGRWINRSRHIIDARLERATWQREHGEIDILANADARGLALAHEGRQP